MEKVKNLVVGAGLSGAVIAERLAGELKEEVLVIDRRSHPAGNIYDEPHPSGIIVQQYGPHIFHTQDEKIWSYLSRFTAWHNFSLRPLAWVDNTYVNLPFNLNSLAQVFPSDLAARLESKLVARFGYGARVPIMQLRAETDPDLQFVAQYIYEKIFEKYSTKQWGISPQQIDPGVMARVPVVISHEDGYFTDKYQAIPAQGYTHLIGNMLRSPLISLRLNTSFEQIKNKITYERLFYTGSIDEFLGYKYGELPYRSLRFEVEQKNTEYFQPAVVVNYPNDFDFTRICEHKYFLDKKSPVTVISTEYPQAFQRGKNEPYYPIKNAQTDALYARYAQEANKLPGVYLLGRLGAYQYCNMQEAVAAALTLFERIK